MSLLELLNTLPRVPCNTREKARKPKASRRMFLVPGNYGRVTLVNKRNPVNKGGVLAFRCQCACGQEVYLREFEIRERKKHGFGCLSQPCPLNTLQEKIDHNPDVSLRLQLFGLLDDRPDEVCAAWGGLSDGFGVDRETGLANLLEYLGKYISAKRRVKWLMRRKDISKPYRKGNIVIRESDDVIHEEKTIIFNGELMSANEMSSMFDVSLYRLLELVARHGTGIALIEQLTEEQQ